MLDGARNALLGYLYQLLGTAAVRVRDVTPGNDAWADLIASVGDGVLRCEEFGQDATIRPWGLPDQGVVAIQFKHSATTGNVIERAGLIDILCAFDRSRQEAATGGVTIDRYVLITNTGIDATARQLIDEARSSSDPPMALRLRLTTRAGKPIADNVKRLAPYGGDADAAAGAWHAVLQTLAVPPPATFEGDLHRLRRFAARYGVLEREWDSRLNALVGAFIRETACGAVEVTREWLKGHLAGDPKAANLQFGSNHLPHISATCRTRLDEWVARQHRIPESCYLPREVLQTIRDQLALYPVVFVYGDGGCGKSLAVAQYLRSVCDSQLVWSEPATITTEARIVDAFNRVRSPGYRGGGTDRLLADVRARLDIANSATPLVWTIDVDGVDEAPDPEQRAEVRDLIRLCWAGGSRERSPALLVLTCRSPTSGARARQHLVSDWIDTPEPDLVHGIGFVSVGEFLQQDLVQAARLVGGKPEDRIISALDPDAAGSRTSLLPVADPIDADILQALCHPVVWGGYASMGDSDREGILNGAPASLACLASQLLVRFLIRCRMRRNWTDDRMLDHALCAVARSVSRLPPYSIADWEKGCAPFLGDTEARNLYHESLTYGLVRRESEPGWRWGHRFVVDYLAAQPDQRGQ